MIYNIIIETRTELLKLGAFKRDHTTLSGYDVLEDLLDFAPIEVLKMQPDEIVDFVALAHDKDLGFGTFKFNPSDFFPVVKGNKDNKFCKRYSHDVHTTNTLEKEVKFSEWLERRFLER